MVSFIGMFVLVLFLHVNLEANAETTYKLLAPLPGGSVEVPVDTGFSLYAAELFRFLLSAAVILALVMLVIGGVEYVGSAGNTSLLGDAKGRMLNALLGLLLALSSWLILNLINPDLVDFGLMIPEIGIGGPIPPGPGPTTCANSPVTIPCRTSSNCNGTCGAGVIICTDIPDPPGEECPPPNGVATWCFALTNMGQRFFRNFSSAESCTKNCVPTIFRLPEGEHWVEGPHCIVASI